MAAKPVPSPLVYCIVHHHDRDPTGTLEDFEESNRGVVACSSPQPGPRLADDEVRRPHGAAVVPPQRCGTGVVAVSGDLQRSTAPTDSLR